MVPIIMYVLVTCAILCIVGVIVRSCFNLANTLYWWFCGYRKEEKSPSYPAYPNLDAIIHKCYHKLLGQIDNNLQLMAKDTHVKRKPKHAKRKPKHSDMRVRGEGRLYDRKVEPHS